MRWHHLHTIMDRTAAGDLVHDPAVDDLWREQMDRIGLGMSRLRGPASQRGWVSLAHKYIDEQDILGALNNGRFVYFDTTGGKWSSPATSAPPSTTPTSK